MTEAAVFEALFTRGFKPDARLVEALRAAGYDVQRPEPRYPTAVWHACIEAARRHLFPSLSVAEGTRRLGAIFADGYFNTLIGKVIGAALPLLGPERAIQRLPRYWSATQPDLGVEVVKAGERHYAVTLREKGILADFCAGLLEGSVRHTRAEVAITVREVDGTHCVLDVRW
jgi:uncharacterized protein (TIGR02265 family)